MAQFNGNNAYLSIDGTQVQAHFIKLQINPTAESVDTTAGAGATHTMRKPGLRDTKVKATIAYDDTVLTTYISKMKPGVTYRLVMGTEGNAVGKPKHEGDFVLVAAPIEITVKNDPVAFELDFDGAHAPVIDMHNGGVW